MRTKTALQSDKMLDAAARLFGTQRFHEVRMEDIAAEAGVGKGTLYRYFKDKEELYLALLDRASRQLHDRLEQTVADKTVAKEKLRSIVAAIISFFDEQPHLFDLIQHAEVMGGPNFPWQKTRDELLKLVTRAFKEAKAQGEFAVRDPDTAVLLLLGGMRAVIRFGKRPRPRDLPRRIVEAFLHGNTVTGADWAIDGHVLVKSSNNYSQARCADLDALPCMGWLPDRRQDTDGGLLGVYLPRHAITGHRPSISC